MKNLVKILIVGYATFLGLNAGSLAVGGQDIRISNGGKLSNDLHIPSSTMGAPGSLAIPLDGISSTKYASDAVKMAKANRALGCGYGGGRWSLDWKAHRNWANTVSKRNLISEYKNRRSLLTKCTQSIASLHSNPNSQKYATDAVKMAKANRALGCGYGGGRWSLDWKAHRNWANTVSKSNLISEYNNRRNMLNRCIKTKY